MQLKKNLENTCITPKPPEYFNYGTSKNNIDHFQMRNPASLLRSHWIHDFSIDNHSSPRCSAKCEDNQNFSLIVLHDDIRMMLFEKRFWLQLPPSLELLIFGDNMLNYDEHVYTVNVVHDYIHLSGRFS